MFHPIIRFFLAALVGAFLGLFSYVFATSGIFVKWAQLPQVPYNVSQLRSTIDLRPAVETDQGGVMVLRDNKWVRVDGIDRLGSQQDVTVSACTLSEPAFWFPADPPDEVRDCLREEIVIHDVNSHVIYALSPDNTVWQWQHISTGWRQFGKLVRHVVIGGMTLGLIAAVGPEILAGPDNAPA